jgi:hypothetical protein
MHSGVIRKENTPNRVKTSFIMMKITGLTREPNLMDEFNGVSIHSSVNAHSATQCNQSAKKLLSTLTGYHVTRPLSMCGSGSQNDWWKNELKFATKPAPMVIQSASPAGTRLLFVLSLVANIVWTHQNFSDT